MGEDAVNQAYFRDGRAIYNDIVWWPKGGDWRSRLSGKSYDQTIQQT